VFAGATLVTLSRGHTLPNGRPLFSPGVHRVIQCTEQPRHSLVYFLRARPDALPPRRTADFELLLQRGYASVPQTLHGPASWSVVFDSQDIFFSVLSFLGARELADCLNLTHSVRLLTALANMHAPSAERSDSWGIGAEATRTANNMQQSFAPRAQMLWKQAFEAKFPETRPPEPGEGQPVNWYQLYRGKFFAYCVTLQPDR
jgi:hypothetical protein